MRHSTAEAAHKGTGIESRKEGLDTDIRGRDDAHPFQRKPLYGLADDVLKTVLIYAGAYREFLQGPRDHPGEGENEHNPEN